MFAVYILAKGLFSTLHIICTVLYSCLWVSVIIPCSGKYFLVALIFSLFILLKGTGNTSRDDNSVKTVFPFFWKGAYSKRKEFAPLGSKYFSLRIHSCHEDLGAQESHQEVTKLSSLEKKRWKTYQVYPVLSSDLEFKI